MLRDYFPKKAFHGDKNLKNLFGKIYEVVVLHGGINDQIMSRGDGRSFTNALSRKIPFLRNVNLKIFHMYGGIFT